MSFSVETAFLVFLWVAHRLAERFHLSPSTLYCIGVLEVGLSNLTLFVSSPELRRRYFGADDTWIPNFRKCGNRIHPTGNEITQAPNPLAYPSQPSLKTTRNRIHARHRRIQSTLAWNPPGLESSRYAIHPASKRPGIEYGYNLEKFGKF